MDLHRNTDALHQGGVYQQALSGVTYTPPTNYVEDGGQFATVRSEPNIETMSDKGCSTASNTYQIEMMVSSLGVQTVNQHGRSDLQL